VANGQCSAARCASTVSIGIVEDEAPIRSFIAEILEDEGYPIVEMTNGLEALAYLRQHPHPRLILLDLGMPLMTGWEFRAEQQRDPTIARIPVSIMSAFPDLDRRVASLKVPACLRKPIDFDRLPA
jgi:CheY-like chemotaxis protein